jgi:hypothetical protein
MNNLVQCSECRTIRRGRDIKSQRDENGKFCFVCTGCQPAFEERAKAFELAMFERQIRRGHYRLG